MEKRSQGSKVRCQGMGQGTRRVGDVTAIAYLMSQLSRFCVVLSFVESPYL